MKLSEIKNVFTVRDGDSETIVATKCDHRRGGDGSDGNDNNNSNNDSDSCSDNDGGDDDVRDEPTDTDNNSNNDTDNDDGDGHNNNGDGDDNDNNSGDSDGGDDKGDGGQPQPQPDNDNGNKPQPDDIEDDDMDGDDPEVQDMMKKIEDMKKKIEERRRQNNGKPDPRVDDLVKRVEVLESEVKVHDNRITNIENRKGDVSSAKIKELSDRIEEVANQKQTVRTKKIKVADLPTVVVDDPHKMLEKVTLLVANNLKPYLYGKAGGGKTTLASQVADALKLEFKPLTISIDTTVQDVLGYVSAIDGTYKTTPIRDAFENGGLLMLDELDSASPEVVTCLNNLIENNSYTFPDGKVVKRNENLRIIAAGNTNGNGASYSYNGRQKLDGSTLDRFVMVEVPYDEDLETRISGNEWWASCVQAYRKACVSLSYDNIIISPRASIQGARMLAAGMSVDDVTEMCIFSKIKDKDMIRRIQNNTVLPPQPQ